VTVDGVSQSEMLGPFIWGRRARAEQLVWAPGEHADFFEGAHDGYRKLGVRHRRSVVFGRAGYWLLFDHIEGTGRHSVRATLQLAPGFVRRDETGFDFASPDAGCVEIRTWLPDGAVTEVVEGREDPPAGWFSGGFGHRVPAPAVRSLGELQLPATLVSAVVPYRKMRDVDVTCTEGPGSGGVRINVLLPEGSDTIVTGEVPPDAGGERFVGAFGLTVRRDGEVARSGVDVSVWTQSERWLEFVSVPNLLVTRSRGAGPSI
jgi:hypothetical protein